MICCPDASGIEYSNFLSPYFRGKGFSFMGEYINFNGNIIRENEPVFKASSRAARFGDGLFETMRVRNGKILFEEMHSERLFNGLALMCFSTPPSFDWSFLRSAIALLLEKNAHHQHARVRLMVTRGDGGIMDEPMDAPQFLVETWEANEYRFEEKGLKVDMFTDFPKARCRYANIKTCNFLPSVMATFYAKENGLDECLLVNDAMRVCDATISNIFWVKRSTVFTTWLNEGGVGGVMRAYLMKLLPEHGIRVIETATRLNELHGAEELFLTNVIRGVRWVKEMGSTKFTNSWSRKVFDIMIRSLNY